MAPERNLVFFATLAGRIAALSGQGPATQDQPTPRRRALVCRVAAQPQAAGVWRPVESPRSTSERDREQFEGQTRARSSFAVFSCGDGGGGVEASGLTLLWRSSLSSTWHFESSEIEDRDQKQARHNVSNDACSCLLRKALLRNSSKQASKKCEYYLVCIRGNFLTEAVTLQFPGVKTISDLLQETLDFLGIV